MKRRVDVKGESPSSWQRSRRPDRDCSRACVGGEGSEAAEGGGCDGGDESCSQQLGAPLDCFDRTESVGLPTSGPAGTLGELHPGG